MSWPYDYIIIGAGSAGCAIANRLAEDLALRILIIEAGPAGLLLHAARCRRASPASARSRPTTGATRRRRRSIATTGACTGRAARRWAARRSINAMLYVRGHASDYDHWRQLGNEGWSYDDVLPYFKKAEHNERGADDFHGGGGPLNVADQIDPAQDQRSLRRAPATQAGHTRNDDFNGAEQEGVGYYQVTQKDQAALEHRQRLSAAGGRAQPEQRPRHLQRAGRAHHPRPEPRHGRALQASGRPRRGRALQPRDHPVPAARSTRRSS